MLQIEKVMIVFCFLSVSNQFRYLYIMGVELLSQPLTEIKK